MPAEHLLYGCPGSGSAAVEMALQRCGLAYRQVQSPPAGNRGRAWTNWPRTTRCARCPPCCCPTAACSASRPPSSSTWALSTRCCCRQPSARAACDGLVFIAANCYSAVGVSDFPERWTISADDEAHEAVRQAARAQLHLAWQHFADQFFDPSQRPWAEWCRTRRARLPGRGGVQLAAAPGRALKRLRPAFHAFLQTLQAHPAVAPVYQAHWPH